MFVAITFFVFLAVKRDALMVSFFIGAINNGILSKVLKKLLNQERPAEISETVKDKPSDRFHWYIHCHDASADTASSINLRRRFPVLSHSYSTAYKGTNCCRAWYRSIEWSLVEIAVQWNQSAVSIRQRNGVGIKHVSE